MRIINIAPPLSPFHFRWRYTSQARVKAEVEAKQKEVDRAKGELGIL